MTKVGFIGAGNMGFAILKGIYEGRSSENVEIHDTLGEIELYAAEQDHTKLERLEKLGVKICDSPAALVKTCKYVFLAVKPQNLETLLPAMKDEITEETVIVSICAGISGDYIKARTKDFVKVVLVMPNTPLMLGEGASALAQVAPTTDGEFELVYNIFAACGTAAVIDESKMKEIIAINGSSPAFIYLFAKAFVDYADAVGIDADAAKALFAKTLIGSAKMITDSGKSIDELIEMVSSKGGTTIAGLEKLRAGGLEQAVNEACKACTARAYELAQ